MKSLRVEKNGRKQCPVCLETLSHSFVFVEEWYGYTIWRCSHCDIVFSVPMKHPGKEFYNGEVDEFFKRVYQSRDLGIFSVGPNHRWAVRNLPIRSGSLLDIGCGNGSFMLYAKKKGFDTWGVDLSEKAVKAGKRYLGINNIFACSLERFGKEICPDVRFDVITFFEVLEHMDDPNSFVGVVKAFIKPGGFVAFSVPNRERPLPNILMPKAGDSPPHHFTRWSKKALINFLERHGFELIKVSTVPVSSAAGAIMDYFLGTDKVSAGVARAAFNESLSGPVRLVFYIIKTLCHAFLKTLDIFLYPLHRKVCLVVIARMD